jgi:hypothetical protein
MKRVIRYLLEGDGSVPKFVESGGYFKKNEELVGISVDDEVRHVPNTVQTVSKEQLVERVMETCLYQSGQPLNEEDAIEMVDGFLAQHGMEDYE